ncbi:MAG TPA: putative ABC exporter domain-containing protein [Patescibacteria group bacterium]|nr:putative ABC exporter domain-containing protein [Patescibacteria group bacterium]
MNHALLFLWACLLRRRTTRFIRGLRRPASCIGLLAVMGLLGFLFYFRDQKFVGQLVRKENLIGAGLVMGCGSVFKGFLQRGLLCEPADVEFLFTSPFTHRQIVVYRLLSNYLFALLQGIVFTAIFASHLAHPLITSVCLVLFQIACFHLATGFALFGGAVSAETHLRLRWAMVAAFFLLIALYLRLAWDFRILPGFGSSPFVQLLFYPAVDPSDVANANVFHRWVVEFGTAKAVSLRSAGQCGFWLLMFAGCAASSLWWLLRLKINPLEAALGASYRAAERRSRAQQGRSSASATEAPACSVALPKGDFFRGAGALLWKNWVAVRRHRKEMMLASFFTITYTGAFTALLWIFHDMEKRAGAAAPSEARAFTTGIALCLGILAFFLQRMFPFDFRQDGAHLLSFRTLPISPFGVALAQITVPTLLCLLAQACGAIPLILWGRFDWPTLIFVVLGFPAVALALNSVWNIHYLLAAIRQNTNRSASSSAAGILMVVALSFLVFYPAGWTTIKVANFFAEQNQAVGFTVAAGVGLSIQYAIDLLLIFVLAKLFQNFESPREG